MLDATHLNQTDAGFAEVHLIFGLHITAKANKPSRVFVTQAEPERLLAPRHLQRLLVFSVCLAFRHQGHGELQGSDEAVRPRTQRRHRDVTQPVRHPF